MDSKQSQAIRPKSLCQKIGEEEVDDVITSQENLNVDLHRRRHAINITNNPGYRVSLKSQKPDCFYKERTRREFAIFCGLRFS